MVSLRKNKKILIVLAIFICFSAAVFFVSYISPSKFFSDERHEGISLIRDNHEIGIYYDRIGYYFNRTLPYSYGYIEYPILGVLYITMPALFSKTMVGYQFGLILQNIVFALLLIVVTFWLLKIFNKKNWVLWLFILPSAVYFIINRFDVFPALLVQLSLLLLVRKQFTWSFIVLSLAFLTKGYAIVFFPIFFVYYLNQKGLAKVNLFKNKYLYILILPTIVVTLFFVILTGLVNGLFPYIFQATRGFSYGSVYLVYIKSLQSILPAWLLGGGVAVAAKVLTLLQITLPLMIYAGYKFFRKIIKTQEDVINWSLLVILLYVQFSVYYSPQWFIWLLPLLVLMVRTKKEVILVILYDFINYLWFPVVANYAGFYSLPFEIIVLVRTILFIVLILFVVKRIMLRAKQAPAVPPIG